MTIAKFKETAMYRALADKDIGRVCHYKALAYDRETKKWLWFMNVKVEGSFDRLALTPLKAQAIDYDNCYMLALRVIRFARGNGWYNQFRVIAEDGFALPLTISKRKELRH